MEFVLNPFYKIITHIDVKLTATAKKLLDQENTATQEKQSHDLKHYLIWFCGALIVLPTLLGAILPFSIALIFGFLTASVSMLTISLLISLRSTEPSAWFFLTMLNGLIATLIITSGGFSSPFLPLAIVAIMETIILAKSFTLRFVSSVSVLVATLSAERMLALPEQSLLSEASQAAPLVCSVMLVAVLGLYIYSMRPTSSDQHVAKLTQTDNQQEQTDIHAIMGLLPGFMSRHAINGDVIEIIGNDKTCDLIETQIKSATLLGQGLVKHIHVADRIGFLQAIDKIRQGATFADVCFRLNISGQNPYLAKTLQIDARCFSASDNEIHIYHHDQTDFIEMRDELVNLRDAEREADIAKTRFLAGVSHELRTPLNSIIGFADILEHEIIAPLPNAQQREYVELIKQSGSHLLSVVNSMLDVSKIQNGQYEIFKECVSFGPILEQTKSMLDVQAKQNNVTLTCRIPKGLEDINADTRAIRQILINLIGNAIKFTPENGVVTVDAMVDDTDFIIKVGDTGIGIAQDQLSKIGQPFVQLSNTYSRHFEGTGLGLSLVKGLVKLHDGHFDIESQEGVGTIVTVKIPKQKPMQKEQGKTLQGVENDTQTPEKPIGAFFEDKTNVA